MFPFKSFSFLKALWSASKACLQDIVLRAVRTDCEALKFALPPLNQNVEILRVAGLASDPPRPGEPYIVTSVKFGLASKSSPYSSLLVRAMRDDPYFSQFAIYFPNAFCKGFCGPDDKFVDFDHPCRGDCQKVTSVCNSCGGMTALPESVYAHWNGKWN